MTDTTPALALKRTGEMCAIFMIGNGIIGLAQPQRQVSLWRSHVKPLDLLVRRFDGRPGKRRLQGALQLAAGLLLASRLRR
ncbi:hypothetical protein [Sphingomonas sp.]|jgi:hypothetical protein|uniref:hypothetical protein n=1 Tax=Sphingomonas sp. TaxID=28214 RepID=UPI002D808DCD|nr:hypothetical protein [Sphingomonas sp.]HEU0043630.1 hypothetical protein [Sphingomonas sp.]